MVGVAGKRWDVPIVEQAGRELWNCLEMRRDLLFVPLPEVFLLDFYFQRV
jgi:hypothetical protein